MEIRPRLKIIIILLVPFIFALSAILKRYPQFVEKYYSDSSNRVIRQILSSLTSPFPFSVAEFIMYSLVIILVALIIKLLISIKAGRFVNQILNVAAYLSLLYILFMVLWGFNYNRPSFGEIAGIRVERYSEQDLAGLCKSLIEKANYLRNYVDENPDGIMTIPGGYKDVLKRAVKGYERAAKVYPELGGKYGMPKPILLSKKMSYTGITGIYIPYTGEANVNINNTDLMLPCTAAHEMAHQRGFAREDEANYIAYVACKMHPDLEFRYSGVALALTYSMNALYNNNNDIYYELRKNYSQALNRDMNYESAFWSRYEGKVEKVADNVNDTYLKSNGQQDGVESYGRMVDLLLAEYKSN